MYASCIVYDYPYRRYYQPERYTYYDHSVYYSNRGRSNVNYTNGRRSFYRPGSQIHYKDGRTAVNKKYKANRRNTAVAESGRRDNSVAQNNTRDNTVEKKVRRNNSVSPRSTVNTTSVSTSKPMNINRGITRTDKSYKKMNTGNQVTTRNSNNRSSTYNRSTSSVNKNNSISNNNRTNRKTNNNASSNSTASSAKQKTTRSNNSKKPSTSGSRRGTQ